MEPHATLQRVTADSPALLLLPLTLCVLISLGLVDALASNDFILSVCLGASLLLLVPYLIWAATLEVTIDAAAITVRRLFGRIPPLVVPGSAISEFAVRCDYSGRMTRFEVVADGNRAIQLHRYQRNFATAVAALRTFYPHVPERVLSKWAI